ncbi:lytic transglycosylase domain-containing protein [Lederbergia citri]|uniref:Lytic transglycosylase domain-containing protein n=1 Tax=Lederbergia citri TaxID=2833580 RepID=A0A942YG93_9BACI|nr:lytic transglycosylase domain-containing protein [Lederbergia citri]MBS4194105.1 lytic transglycosylase domain-containing protein [Lederbergia citri]
MSKKIKTNKNQSKRKRIVLLIFFLPIIFLLIVGIYSNKPEQTEPEKPLIPEEYMPIYKAAEKKFGVPWYLLAAIHRVETIFSTMDPMLSPVGAEGHMQFMPCTFVGWSHPTCTDLGQGDIPDEEKMNPETIAKYNGYGIDANGDGIADPWNIEDAIFSAANYLAKSGAANGDIRKAIFAYNHSDQYVEDVMYYVEIFKNYEESASDLPFDVQTSGQSTEKDTR